MADTVHLIGIDHHRSPIALRERMAVGPADHDALLADVCAYPGVAEAVVLSTCNRCEFAIAGDCDIDAVLALLARRQGVLLEDLLGHCYRLRDRAAVRHLFRVVASLESMLIGEYQIMHQTRLAYESARRAGCTGPRLNPLFQRALAAGKEVRNATGIGRYKLSMASIAVDLAEHIHGRLDRTRLLVIGAGEMAELALRHFVEHGVAAVTLINRTHERALALTHDDTRVPVTVREWSELGAALGAHDIVVASTGATHAVITGEAARLALRRRRAAMMFIDLAVPRDVDSVVGDLDEAYLYNIDDLEQVVAANQQLRADEVDAAAELIDRRVADALRATDRDRGRLHRAVADRFEGLIAAEAERLQRSLDLDAAARDAVRAGLHRLAGKLRHPLMRYLRTHDDDPDAEAVVRELLDLD